MRSGKRAKPSSMRREELEMELRQDAENGHGFASESDTSDKEAGDGESDCLVPEEGDPEGIKYLAEFEVEVIEDVRKECAESGHSIGRDLSAGSSDRFIQWLISPLKLERFHAEFWERRPFLVRRAQNRSMYAGWFGKGDIESLLEHENLRYGLNLDVTKYEDGARSTFSTNGTAQPIKVWEKFAKGWSVRVLHPQRWSDPLFLMLSAFERHWRSVAGCNAYLTPAGSQGFSPHYDDIEAFVIQTEGKKRWRCYQPRSPAEVLPRLSSPDFAQDDIGDPVLDVELEAGDLLYMPRGTIHQAEASPDSHSLHITVSVGQRNSWADFLELAVPRALELAIEDHVVFRRSVPRGYPDYMGVTHSDKDEPKRGAFIEQLMECMNLVAQSIPWDSAADQLAVKFLQCQLPLPDLNKEYGSVSKEGAGTSTNVKTKLGKIVGNSMVRLVAPDVTRLVVEEDWAIVYHILNNSRALHNEGDEEPTSDGRLVFSLDVAPALEELTMAYPKPVRVSALPIPKKEALALVKQLWEIGLLVVAPS